MRSIRHEDVPAPEALADSEYVDFSPTEEFRPVIEHIISGASAPS